jgi:hypothetical protein
MSTSKSSQQTPGGLRPARRSVVKGAAWAVPAVMVASAAPASAQSPCLTAEFSGDSCKCPGTTRGFTYTLSVCFTNNCSTVITVRVKRFVSNSGVVLQPPVEETLVIAQGERMCTTQRTFTSTNSANFIDVFFDLNGVEQDPIRLPSPPDCEECPGVTTTEETTTEAPAAETTETSTTTESSSSETTTPATETTAPETSTAPPSEDTTTATSGP